MRPGPNLRRQGCLKSLAQDDWFGLGEVEFETHVAEYVAAQQGNGFAALALAVKFGEILDFGIERNQDQGIDIDMALESDVPEPDPHGNFPVGLGTPNALKSDGCLADGFPIVTYQLAGFAERHNRAVGSGVDHE